MGQHKIKRHASCKTLSFPIGPIQQAIKIASDEGITKHKLNKAHKKGTGLTGCIAIRQKIIDNIHWSYTWQQ